MSLLSCISHEPFLHRIPRLLPCSHCYCELCLDLQLKGTNGKALKCPECRQSHPVSFRRVKTFPQNKYTLALLRAAKAMEGHDGQNQVKVEVTKKCSVFPAEISYQSKDMMNELKLPEEQDIPQRRTDSTCDICNVTLCDDRNLYIHKFLKHGKKNTLAILHRSIKWLMLLVSHRRIAKESHVQSTILSWCPIQKLNASVNTFLEVNWAFGLIYAN